MSQMCLMLQGQSALASASQTVYNFGGTGDFTLEAWVRPTVAGPVITRKGTEGGESNGGFLLYLHPGGVITLATDSGWGYYLIDSNPTVVLDGQWHHLAGVRQSGSLALYLDGQVLPATVAASVPTPADVSNSLRLLVGSSDQQSQPDNQYQGLIDEVRVWNVARSAPQIAAGMGTQADPTSPGLVGYYSFDSSALADLSPTNNPAALTGSAQFTTRSAPLAATPETLEFLTYRGAYATEISSDSGSTWSSAAAVRFMGTDQLVIDQYNIQRLQVGGNTLNWPAGVTPQGQMTVKVDQATADYWPPDGPPSVPFFEGTLQIQGTNVMWRGFITPDISPCRWLWSLASGLVVDPGTAQSGSALTVQTLAGGETQHFCLTTNGGLMHMQSGLMAQAASGSAGAAVTLEPATGGTSQQWTQAGGMLLSATSTMPLALTPSGSAAGSTLVVQATQSPPATTQLFALLTDAQAISNGAGGMLDTVSHSSAAGAVLTTAIAGTTAVPTQGWHITPSGQPRRARAAMADVRRGGSTFR